MATVNTINNKENPIQELNGKKYIAVFMKKLNGNSAADEFSVKMEIIKSVKFGDTFLYKCKSNSSFYFVSYNPKFDHTSTQGIKVDDKSFIDENGKIALSRVFARQDLNGKLIKDKYSKANEYLKILGK